MRKILLTVFAVALLFGNTEAQEIACKINNYSIQKGFKGSGLPIHGVEVGYVKSLGKLFNFYMPLRLGPRAEVKNTVNSETIKTQMIGTIALDFALQAKYDNGHNFVVPFISAGMGFELYDRGLELGAPIGGGLNFRIKPKVFITLATQYRLPLTKTSPEGFCHSLGVIVNLRQKETNEKPFVSKLPVQKTNSLEQYALLEAQAQAQKEAEILEKIQKEAEAKEAAELTARVAAAQAEADERAKMAAITPIEVSTEVQEVLDFALKGVQFETGSAQLTQSSYAILDELATTLEKNPTLKISIEGHTDRTGNESINIKLSEARAKACKTYLTSKGVNAERLKESGFGSTRPVSDNDTPEGRTLNRRVEFIPF